MQVSRSGYYGFCKCLLSRRAQKRACLLLEAKAIHKESHASYGSRRIAKALTAKGYTVGRYQARRLMHEANLQCKQRRRYQVTTQSKHKEPIADNILNRQFMVKTANCVWLSDITYIATHEGWLYLAVVMDLYSRRIIGWCLDDTMTVGLVKKALHMALASRPITQPLLHHSDRGIQYASHEYRTLLQQHNIQLSMSRKGNCWDNAVMERFFGSLKSERTDYRIYPTKAQAKADIVDYILMYYNAIRLHSALGYKSPVQFEKFS